MHALKSIVIFIVLFIALIATPYVLAGDHGVQSARSKPEIKGGDIIHISGSVLDSHEEPISDTQVNALYMEHGQYKSADFLRVGTPLSLIFVFVLATVLHLFY